MVATPTRRGRLVIAVELCRVLGSPIVEWALQSGPNIRKLLSLQRITTGPRPFVIFTKRNEIKL